MLVNFCTRSNWSRLMIAGQKLSLYLPPRSYIPVYSFSRSIRRKVASHQFTPYVSRIYFTVPRWDTVVSYWLKASRTMSAFSGTISSRFSSFTRKPKGQLPETTVPCAILLSKTTSILSPSISASFWAMDNFTLIYKRPFAVVVSYSSSVVSHSQLWSCKISMIL